MNCFKKLSRPTVCLLALLLTIAPSAYAHAHPKTMTPAPDSAGPAPSKISITFSEAVEPKFSSIKLTDTAGKSVDSETSAPVSGDAATITLKVPSLRPGIYVVHWTNVSVDGHHLAGSYKFTVR